MRRATLCAALAVAGCASVPRQNGAATSTVTATAETRPVATTNADAADDPAIWRNPADRAASLIVATDKKGGLYVFGLDGGERSFFAEPGLNNVDLRDGVPIGGRPGILVGASNRADTANAAISLFRLDPAGGRLAALATIPAGSGEGYGFCLGRVAGAMHAVLVLKDGTIRVFALDTAGPMPAARLVRTEKLATQAEGCVVDDRTGQLYVGEEDVGIWRINLTRAGNPQRLASVDGARLVADVEGLAIAPDGADGGYLVASSQGDSAYAVYRLPDGGYVGRFRIGDGAVDGTSDTDGIEIALANFGPDYPAGLLVAQDGDNAPEAQNFKLLDWRRILVALHGPPY